MARSRNAKTGWNAKSVAVAGRTVTWKQSMRGPLGWLQPVDCAEPAMRALAARMRRAENRAVRAARSNKPDADQSKLEGYDAARAREHVMREARLGGWLRQSGPRSAKKSARIR